MAWRACSTSKHLQAIYEIWTEGFYEMQGFLKSMLLRDWRLVLPVGALCGATGAAVARFADSEHEVSWFVAVFCISAFIQYFVVPSVLAWSMRRSFPKHYDMNPRHMKAVWTGSNPNESTMLVISAEGKPIGVVALLAGPAKVAMSALRAVRTRGPAKATPLFGATVQAAARAAADNHNLSYRPCSVFRVSVDRRVRGRGAGRLLMDAAEEWAAEHGYTHIELTTASPTAIRFYERLGYSVHYTKLSILEFRVVHMRKPVKGGGAPGGGNQNDTQK